MIPKLELHHLVKSHCLCQYLQVSAELLMRNHSFTIAASGRFSASKKTEFMKVMSMPETFLIFLLYLFGNLLNVIKPE